MYGTVAKCSVIPGHIGQVKEILKDWGISIKPLHKGAVAAYSYQADADPTAIFIVAVFSDRESYQAQGEVAEQAAWYGRLREHLAGDPQWNDGEIVTWT